ncbi:MAG: hypothetical protein ACOX0U_03345 [Oscillospiraceae bacterium]|jgi:hypothetical protein
MNQLEDGGDFAFDDVLLDTIHPGSYEAIAKSHQGEKQKAFHPQKALEGVKHPWT